MKNHLRTLFCATAVAKDMFREVLSSRTTWVIIGAIVVVAIIIAIAIR